jgi:hypothetical protein
MAIAAHGRISVALKPAFGPGIANGFRVAEN